jgi:hypothetical protein
MEHISSVKIPQCPGNLKRYESLSSKNIPIPTKPSVFEPSASVYMAVGPYSSPSTSHSSLGAIIVRPRYHPTLADNLPGMPAMKDSSNCSRFDGAHRVSPIIQLNQSRNQKSFI